MTTTYTITDNTITEDGDVIVNLETSRLPAPLRRTLIRSISKRLTNEGYRVVGECSNRCRYPGCNQPIPDETRVYCTKHKHAARERVKFVFCEEPQQ